MKKLFLLLMMTFMQINLFAYEWTDDNGVKWTYSKNTYTINGISQELWTITDVSNYGENVDFPSVVYNGSTEYTIEAIDLKYYARILDYTPSGSFIYYYYALTANSVSIPATIKYIKVRNNNSSSSSDYPALISKGIVTINATTPPVLFEDNYYHSCFENPTVTIMVSNNSLSSYCEADVWKKLAVRIISKDAKTDYTVNSTAREAGSGLHVAIGEENLGNVMSLKVSGTINSYDILVMRNKMHNLHYLDMTDATIVASNYPFYESYKTSNNTICQRMFYNMDKLISVKLPKTITKIEEYAFYSCSGLNDLVCQGNLESIESYAVAFCDNLWNVTLNNGLKRIEPYAFYYSSLSSLKEFPNGLTYIGENAFCHSSLYSLTKLPDGLTSIEPYTFSYTSLANLKKLPDGLTSIGSEAFHKSNISEITIPGNVSSFGTEVFYECSKLKSVTIQEGIKTIPYRTFYECYNLFTVNLPTTLKTIGEGAFHGCRLTSINLPEGLTTIGKNAFSEYKYSNSTYYRNKFAELHLPSSITSIGEKAFDGCSNLKDIYTYTLEPTNINENTFSVWTTATLHVPTMAYYNYYFNTQWSKFASLVEDNDYQYTYFYVTQDYTFNDGADTSEKPDADLNGGSGLIINNSTSTVTLGDVHIADNGTVSGSIVAKDNLTVENLFFDLAVSANKWYFLSLPFKVKISNVTAPGPYVFRYYDGAARAANGKGGWKNVETDYLEAHTGYIFQTNTAGTLTFQVEPSEISFSDEARQNTMTAHTSANSNNASWNFMGNPFPCYYDIDNTGYEAPVTVWTGSAYKAVRPGDDQYHIGPFQAFFVQKPETQEAINFPFSGCHTYQQWATIVQDKNEQAAARQRAAGINRQLINLTIGNGETTDDYTRIVFNELKSTCYEMDCDAAKFFSPEAVAQLYTVNGNTQYAINERPMGDVQLGYVAAESGYLTITAERMDLPMMLTDHVMNITHNLAEGPYTFTTESGTFNERFTLTASQSGITDIRQLQEQTSAETIIYNLGGQQMMKQNGNGAINLPKGVYVRKSAEKNSKVTIR